MMDDVVSRYMSTIAKTRRRTQVESFAEHHEDEDDGFAASESDS